MKTFQIALAVPILLALTIVALLNLQRASEEIVLSEPPNRTVLNQTTVHFETRIVHKAVDVKEVAFRIRFNSEGDFQDHPATEIVNEERGHWHALVEMINGTGSYEWRVWSKNVRDEERVSEVSHFSIGTKSTSRSEGQLSPTGAPSATTNSDDTFSNTPINGLVDTTTQPMDFPSRSPSVHPTIESTTAKPSSFQSYNPTFPSILNTEMLSSKPTVIPLVPSSPSAAPTNSQLNEEILLSNAPSTEPSGVYYANPPSTTIDSPLPSFAPTISKTNDPSTPPNGVHNSLSTMPTSLRPSGPLSGTLLTPHSPSSSPGSSTIPSPAPFSLTTPPSLHASSAPTFLSGGGPFTGTPSSISPSPPPSNDSTISKESLSPSALSSAIPTSAHFTSSLEPTLFPERTEIPTQVPTREHSEHTTGIPSRAPTPTPTGIPTLSIPSSAPTSTVSSEPSPEPSSYPSPTPSYYPTLKPTQKPHVVPTASPAKTPTASIVNGVQPSCNTIDESRYNMCLDLQFSSADRMSAFQTAKTFWESVILGHTKVWNGIGKWVMENSAKNDVWATQVPDNVDDIYIAAFEVEIDGVDGVLGSAGPIFIDSETNLPISGRMKFDKEDLAWLSTEAWENTVVHEMGHVLGIGSLWTSKGILTQTGNEYTYTGSRAQAEWASLGCTDSLPIEADYGEGTAGSHFDEACMKNELMTGFLDVGVQHRLSRISIASLEDLGYKVSYDSADDYTLSNINQNMCCNPNKPSLRGRDLYPMDPLSIQKRPLSERLYEMAANEAAVELQFVRDNPPEVIPEGMKYIGGTQIKILVVDEEGEIQDVSFTWSQVEHRARKR